MKNIKEIKIQSILEDIFDATPDFENTGTYHVEDIEITIFSDDKWTSINPVMSGSDNVSLAVFLLNNITLDNKENIAQSFVLPQLLYEKIFDNSDAIKLIKEAYPTTKELYHNFNERKFLNISEEEIASKKNTVKDVANAIFIKEEILQLTEGKIDTDIMSNMLDSLIKATAQDINNSIDNFLVENAQDLDEWSIGLSTSKNIIENNYLKKTHRKHKN